MHTDSAEHSNGPTDDPGASDKREGAAHFGAVVASVTQSIRDEDQLLEMLHRLAEAACEVIDAADYASVTIDLHGRTFTACTTDERILTVDGEQYELGEGPCLTASRDTITVIADCVSGDPRWPHFGPTARDVGIAAALATPIRTTDSALGAINLFSSAAGGFDHLDDDMVSALASTVGRAVGDYVDLRTERETVDGLRTAIEHRAPIEQAKGILMALHRIGPDEAFTLLTRRSQNANRKLRDIAVDFVAAVTAVDAEEAASPTT